MSIVIKAIERFQTDRGLDKQAYEAPNEHTSIVEELLEAIGFDVLKENRGKLKEAFMGFCAQMANEGISVDTIGGPRSERQLQTAEVVDAYADIVVFAIGAMMKLGFDPEKVLSEVGKEINSRSGSMVDGKFEKDLSDGAKAKWYKADYDKAKR